MHQIHCPWQILKRVRGSVDLHHLQACQRLAARSLPVVVVVIQWAIENSDCHKPHASIPTSERSFTGSWSSSWGSFATKSGLCFAFSKKKTWKVPASYEVMILYNWIKHLPANRWRPCKRCMLTHRIMKSLAHRRKLRVNMSNMF